MERLEMMKETLMSAVQAQMANLQNVDTKELGEAIDMIKDLAETMYYCTITEAMEEKSEKEEHQQQPIAYFSERIREPYPYHADRDMDKNMRRMYYPGGNSDRGTSTHDNTNSSSNSASSRQYSEPMYRNDEAMGRSPERRKMYMEHKKTNDRQSNIKELEAYIQELGSDLTEMISGATLEEKQLLQRKLAALANKIPEA